MTPSTSSWLSLRGLLLSGALLASGALRGAGPCEAFRFAPPRDVMPLAAAATVRSADVNGDGLVDLIAVEGSRVHGAVQRPDGTFSPLAPRDLGAHGLLVADVDGDGTTDPVVLADDGPRRLWVSAEGRLETGPPAVPPVAIPTRPIAVADLDGDGREEFAWAGIGTTPSSHYWAAGLDWWDGAKGLSVKTLDILSSPASLLSADFDRDGRPDLVVSGGYGRLHRGWGATSGRP